MTNNLIFSSTLKQVGSSLKLKNLPEGSLFKFGSTIALKTEYHDDAIIAYIVTSGERFWGGVNSPKALENLVVQPLDFCKVEQKVNTFVPPPNARRAIWTDPCIANGNPKYEGMAWKYKSFGNERGWERMNHVFRPDGYEGKGQGLWICEDDLVFIEQAEDE